MKILGIESSCDETAAAVVQDGQRLLSNVIKSQIDIHKIYGGVVPEVAARNHLEVILPVIDQALKQADCNWDKIEAIAVTYAPGLIGSLLVGHLTAQTMAVLHNKPLYQVHHVEGHVYANFITEQGPNINLNLPRRQPDFPLLALIVSGGHSQLVLFKKHGDYQLLGQTQDDAVGEAFDKVAKILGLPYPGGPSIAQAAQAGDPKKYQFTQSKMHNPLDFSFSGLKTAVLRAVQAECGKNYDFPSTQLAELLNESQKADFAASFQTAAVKYLVDNTVKAYQQFKPTSVVIAGGVAANQELRHHLKAALPCSVDYAPIELCTDNAAMIAALGYYQAQNQPAGGPADPLKAEVIPSLSMAKTAWSV